MVCRQLNIATGNAVAVAVANTLGWVRNDAVRLGKVVAPPAGTAYAVMDAQGNAVQSQLIVDPHDAGVYDLVFVPTVPAVSVVTFFVTLVKQAAAQPEAVDVTGTAFNISNGVLTLQYDANGVLTSWANAQANFAVGVSVGFFNYTEQLQTDLFNIFTGSNVYTFVPHPTVPVTSIPPATGHPLTSVVTANGPLVWELTQTFADCVVLVTRLVAKQTYAEFQPRLGTLPIYTASVMMRFATAFGKGRFWSDSNYYKASGRLQGPRKLNLPALMPPFHAAPCACVYVRRR